MDEIFRFLMLRPPQTGTAVEATPGSALAAKLTQAQAASGSRVRSMLKTAASDFMASPRKIGSLADLNFGDQLSSLADRFARWSKPDFDDLDKAIEAEFGKPAADVAAIAGFKADRERISDHLIAAKLLSRDDGMPAATIERLLLVWDMVKRTADSDPDLIAPGGVRRALVRPTVVGIIKKPDADRPPRKPPSEGDGGKKKLEEMERRGKVLEKLLDRLGKVGSDDLAMPVDKRDERGPEPPSVTEAFRNELLADARRGNMDRLRSGVASALRAELGALAVASNASGIERPGQSSLMLKSKVAERVNPSERKLLRDMNLDMGKQAIPEVMSTLGAELRVLTDQMIQLQDPPGLQYAMVGKSLIPMAMGIVGAQAFGIGIQASVPSSHSALKPIGVGDLLVVRQQLKRYEGGELAHIENILKGEAKLRVHERSRETEQTTTVEVETKKDEERDTQTTERFELKREASQVIKEDMSLKAGLSVSGSYGPTIEFKAYADVAMNRSKEESAKTASNYSKEVTSRASSRVSERQRTEQIMRTLEIFKEKNEHGFDNKLGTDHVVGVYQWVDKVYEAQVFNYGKRMLFDVMLPEPGAFWLHANSTRPVAGSTLTRPTPYTLSPAMLSPANYATYVQRYQVAGIKPPPEAYVTLSKTFDGTISHDDFGSTSKVTELLIPAGYRAISGHAVATGSTWESDWLIVVSIGRQTWTRNSSSYVNHYFSLDNETDSIPLGLRTFHVATFYSSIEVNCQRTDRALEAWRLETHAAIQQAYLKMERDYQDELAALEVQAANNVQGRNPGENRRIERVEIKRLAISTLTAQHFDMFGAISYSSQGYPQPDLPEADAEGRYIRFFEQAFEWEQMMYLFYPYFWGRKAHWREQALLQDTDPQFAEFLRAGSARAVLPVRPGFEPAVAHFLDTGEIWEGADPPTLTSPTYVSIVQEIKERDQAPGSEVAQGDPWDVRIPTTLVRLRDDNDLPEWEKQADGTWVPA